MTFAFLSLAKTITALTILASTTTTIHASPIQIQRKGKMPILVCAWTLLLSLFSLSVPQTTCGGSNGGRARVGWLVLLLFVSFFGFLLMHKLACAYFIFPSLHFLPSSGLGHNTDNNTVKGDCPPGHISDCRYIVMMHPPKPDKNIDQDKEVTIASTGTHRTTITTHQLQNPGWFKLLNYNSNTNTIANHNEQQDGAVSTTSSTTPTINSLTVGDLVWYSVTMDPTTAEQIQQQQLKHQIKYLIPDLPVQMYGRVQSHPPSWGLDRIDQRTDKLDGLYHYPRSAGQNVTIYVIDTYVRERNSGNRQNPCRVL